MAAPAGGEKRGGATGMVAGIGLAAFAVLCCAGLPLVGGLIGGLTLAGVLGIGAGVLIAAATVCVAVVVVRARRERACDSPAAGSSKLPPRGSP